MAFERKAGHIWLRYMVDVPEEAIDLPGPANPERIDGLWQSTCFEAFARSEEGQAYTEYNFSPSSQWAAYAFDGYRSEMRARTLRKVPEVWLEGASSWFAIEVEAELQDADADKPIDLGLSAIIEERDGTKSYWALRHPLGQPDFHHPDCFALTLEAPPPA